MDGNADMPQVGGATVSYANQSAYLEVASGYFRAPVVDHSSTCTATHERPCHVVRQLTAWNELLFPARMQLQEIPGARGELALVSIDYCYLLLPEAPDFQMRQSTAYGFMHSLLKHHKCLASLHVTPFHFDKYTPPLCDALPHSRLKKLKLCCGLPLPQDICAVIPSLTSLEELECSFFSDSCAEFPTALAALVRASPFLVGLSLAGISMEEQATKHLLTCLTKSGILKDLTLERRVVPETCREELSQYLMFSTSLTSLSFADDSENTEIAVLKGIFYNRTISKVIISTFTGNAESIQLVAGILSENTAVNSFAIISICEEVSPVHNIAYDTWLEALRKNEALEELSIPCRIWNTQQWIRFSDILSSKHRLKKVYILPDRTNYNHFTHVCHTLEDSGVHDKVSCGLYLVKDNAYLLKCKMFSGLYFAFGVREEVKATALRQLLDCSHVTCLILDILRGNLAVSSALAEYVLSTSVLRELQLTTAFDAISDVSDASWKLIVQSLSRNNSIKDLNICVSDMSDRDAESLVDAVSANKNIRKLTFAACGMMTLNAFLNRLSVGIMGNHTLLSVVLQGRLDEEGKNASRKLFAICEATRRNSGLLAAAAAFSKATDVYRYSAAALERICKRHAELLEDLAELVEVSVSEIGGMAHRHLQRTASLDEFMRITGVVKERVVCRPHEDVRMQLDDLGEVCWQMVRRFLMLDDVEEAATHPDNL